MPTQICPHPGCFTVDKRVMAQRLDASLVPIDAAPLVLSEVAGAKGWLLVRETGPVNGRGLLTATRMRNDAAPYELTLFDDVQLRFEPSRPRRRAISR